MIQMGSAFCSSDQWRKLLQTACGQNNFEAVMEKVVSNIEPTLVKQTISKETSDKLRKYMKETVDSGTGTKGKDERLYSWW